MASEHGLEEDASPGVLLNLKRRSLALRVMLRLEAACG